MHPSGKIIKLSTVAPWKEHLFQVEEAQGIAGETLYVLYQDSRGGWRVQCVPPSLGSFACRKALPADFHRQFRECLHGIQADGLLARHDVTQPMGLGTRLARTRVTRCLIGKPGITYKYLGVRMFAHPWSGQESTAACAARTRR